jgi:hypothetical protein
MQMRDGNVNKRSTQLPDIHNYVRRLCRQAHRAQAADTVTWGIVTSAGVGICFSFLSFDAAFYVGCGVLVGFCIVAVVRRPSLLETARQFDDAHHTAELLATALMTPAQDAWSATIYAQAMAAVRRCDASVFKRMQPRTRAALLMLSAALLSGVWLVNMSGRDAGRLSAENYSADASSIQANGSTESTSSRQQSINELHIARREPVSGVAKDQSFNPLLNQSSTVAQPSDNRSDDAAALTTGSGHADAKSRRTEALPGDVDLSNRRLSNSHAKPHGAPPLRVARGADIAGDGSGAADVRGAVIGAAIDTNPAGRPWDMSDWPTRSADAIQRTGAQSLPDEYKAIVRDYFDR